MKKREVEGRDKEGESREVREEERDGVGMDGGREQRGQRKGDVGWVQTV